MAASASRGRKRKSSAASALEGSLEVLQEVSTSLNKKNPRKKSEFVYSFDASGREVRQNINMDLLLIELVAGAQNVIMLVKLLKLLVLKQTN